MQMNSTRLREKDDLRGKKRKKRGETWGQMVEEGLGGGGGR